MGNSTWGDLTGGVGGWTVFYKQLSSDVRRATATPAHGRRRGFAAAGSRRGRVEPLAMHGTLFGS